MIVLVALVGAGYFWGFKTEQLVLQKKLNSIHPLRSNNSGYKLIDPLLAYIIPSSEQEVQMASLKNNISKFISTKEDGNNISSVSVFFYDLNRGRWRGADQNSQYNPASMLKVVVMVAYLKESEVHPDVLKKYLVYTEAIDNFIKQNPFNTPSDLKIGDGYTTDDLINKMIIDSDNGAEFLLLDNINQTYLDSIYNALNIENPNGKNDFTISPRAYSLFLRILYSSTYLNQANSEKALDILSKASFNDGLVALLPKEIVIAHKYGEYIVQQNNMPEQIELHDCGIIYYPKNPYLLCIMTKGKDLNSLKFIIQNISSLVYQDYSAIK